MPASRTVVIAGAGIGGLTASLSLAARGFRVVVFETAERLDPIGAGIQLSPNASRILIDLGLEDQLKPQVVCPEELIVKIARTGHILARTPLGKAVEQTYGAPYWVIHRADLQTALADAASASPNIELRLGSKIDTFTAHDRGVMLEVSRGMSVSLDDGDMLICADGLWSSLRRQCGHRNLPKFAHHTAWRALIPADAAPAEMRAPAVNLWIGHNAHLVHYPVKGGNMINIVAILRDAWNEPGWSSSGLRRDVLDRFSADPWHANVRDLLRAAEHWQKWALFDCAPLRRWSRGAVTLLGDAAHPMLPYLAQGAAMAIEDAAVLGKWLGLAPDDIPGALCQYEKARLTRTAKVQRAARRNGIIYHMGRHESFLRTLARFTMGGDKLVRRYDWLYGWRP
ncbi:MAG TPA: FAD-dependent monooxygenase [Xanthobacteraceae bacterium]|nr:FAD-dependent monooxygenase [Xanthobacteraceae bacterium]